jgi:hypothetical protein
MPVVAVVVKMHEAALRDLLKSPSGPVAKDLMGRGRRVQTRAKQLSPVRTGRLRSSISVTPVTVDGEFTVWVSSNVVYAPYAHRRGTAPASYLEEALSAAR